MIKLKNIFKEQAPGVQTAPTPPAPAPAKQQPAVQTQKPSMQPAAPAFKGKPQEMIYKIKLRLNSLAIKVKTNKFLVSLRNFDLKVTKNTTDNTTIQEYLAPLKGDLESLKGALLALESELEKLDAITKE